MNAEKILGFASCALGLLPLLSLETKSAKAQQLPQAISSNVIAAASGTSAAFSTVLNSLPGKILFVCGADVTMSDTAASTATAQLSNGVGGLGGGIQNAVLTYQLSPIAGATNFSLRWNPCLPVPATNASLSLLLSADANRTTAFAYLFGYLY